MKSKIPAVLCAMTVILSFACVLLSRAPQEMMKREIVSTDRQIDTLVDELYGLSPDEIKIIEGKE